MRFRIPVRLAAPACIFLGVLFLDAFRVDRAPDIHGDEIMYWQAGTNLATKGRITWLEDTPVWVHPPLFFVAEAVVAKTLPPDGDAFAGIFALRGLSAFFGAVTAVLVYELVRLAFGAREALLAGALFALDPFVIRICRRVMIETQMGLLIVLGLYLFWRFRDRLDGARLIATGLVCGLALLTKELAIFPLAGCLVVPWLRRDRRMLSRTLAMLGLAFLVWTSVPLAAAAAGRWGEFREAKLLGVERLIGLVPTTSWKNPAIALGSESKTQAHRHLQNLPSVSLAQALVQNRHQYGSTYALIAAAPFLVLFSGRIRRAPGGPLLLSWFGASAAFLAASALLGTAHVQFGYLLLPPVCAVAGVALLPSESIRARRVVRRDTLRILIIATVLSFGVARWIVLFGVGEDDSYHRLARYLEQHVPAGTTVNASQPVTVEPSSRWLFPDHPLTAIRDPAVLQRRGIRYAILSSKDVWGGYGRLSEDYVRWLRENGRVVFHARGNTFWDLDLFELPDGAGRSE